MSITTTLSRVMGGDPTSVPRWTQPITFEESACEYLGDHGGRRWFDWPAQRLQLEEVGELIDPSSPAIPDGPLFKVWQDGGGYKLQPLRVHLRGTYEARTTVVERPLPTPAAQAPVDVLNGVSLLTGQGGAGPYAFRGPEQIIARFRANGIEFRSVGDGADVLVTAEGGRLITTNRNDIALVAPLLVPYMLTGVVDCEVTPDCKREAITVAFAIPANLAWCSVCGGAA